MAQYGHTPTQAEVERQIRWELKSIEEGARRVRSQMAEQNVADSDVGMKMMRRVAPELIRTIKAAQKDAKEGLTRGTRGQPVRWWWLIVMLPPEKLAVITLKSIFSAKPRELSFNFPVSGIAASISTAAQTQIDFETWKAEQSGKEREDNQFLEYLRTTKQMDVRSYRRFQQKIGRIRQEKWKREHGIILGVKLIECLVDARPDLFSVSTNRIKHGRYETQLVLTEEAREMLADLTEQSELSNPRLMPTVIPPADWRRAN